MSCDHVKASQQMGIYENNHPKLNKTCYCENFHSVEGLSTAHGSKTWRCCNFKQNVSQKTRPSFLGNTQPHLASVQIETSTKISTASWVLDSLRHLSNNWSQCLVDILRYYTWVLLVFVAWPSVSHKSPFKPGMLMHKLQGRSPGTVQKTTVESLSLVRSDIAPEFPP